MKLKDYSMEELYTELNKRKELVRILSRIYSTEELQEEIKRRKTIAKEIQRKPEKALELRCRDCKYFRQNGWFAPTFDCSKRICGKDKHPKKLRTYTKACSDFELKI